MTESEKFTLIEKVKKDIQNMGLEFNQTENKVEIQSEWGTAWIYPDGKYMVQTFFPEDYLFGQREWEDLCSDIDNLKEPFYGLIHKLKKLCLICKLTSVNYRLYNRMYWFWK